MLMLRCLLDTIPCLVQHAMCSELFGLKTLLVMQEEVPFAWPVAKYPVSKRPLTLPTFADRKEVCPSALLACKHVSQM